MTRAVVIGTGPAGITAAATLRRLDPGGTVISFSAEPSPPYSPAAMADHFLTGRTSTLYWKGEDVATRLGIDEHRDRVVEAVDTDNREVVLHGGERVGYEALVIASGSRLYAPIDGADLPGVLDFKSLRAASRLVAAVRAGTAQRVLVVGHGFIGVELSLLLAELGAEVTVVGRRPWVMPRVLDPATAAIAEAALVQRGVRLRLGTPAEAFVGSENVDGVRLAGGEVLHADLVVAATGVKPHIEFLEGSGVDTEWGVAVDDRLRTSVAGVTAAGDVAEAADWLTGRHYVHAIFPNAVAQGPVAAANALGGHVAYEGAEAFNSLKHLGVPIVAIGTMQDADDVLRVETAGTLRTLFLRGGQLVGAQLAGDIRGAGIYRSLIRRRVDVGRFGFDLAEGRFGEADVVFDALRIPATTR